MNRKNRTDEEEAAANQAGGVVNQVKGNVKEAIGTVLGDEKTKREGTHDRLKGRLQEEYGDVKERESEIERDLEDVSGDPNRGRA